MFIAAFAAVKKSFGTRRENCAAWCSCPLITGQGVVVTIELRGAGPDTAVCRGPCNPPPAAMFYSLELARNAPRTSVPSMPRSVALNSAMTDAVERRGCSCGGCDLLASSGVVHDSRRNSNRFTRLWQILLRRGNGPGVSELPELGNAFGAPSSDVARRPDERLPWARIQPKTAVNRFWIGAAVVPRKAHAFAQPSYPTDWLANQLAPDRQLATSANDRLRALY
jgi:hypothetical protein